ncbi:MAG: hypothetical protein ACRYFU_13045 [Janthinobacterium lividum]
MSYVTHQSTAETIRKRLEVLRNFHSTAVCSGDECLRVAMAEYAQHFLQQQMREPA